MLRPEVEAEVARLGLGDAVTLTGRIDDNALVRHYQAADLFALPTQAYEGFGMVTLEALACGTPVVGTPVGATPEIPVAPLDPALVSRDAAGGRRPLPTPCAPGWTPIASPPALAPASTRWATTGTGSWTATRRSACAWQLPAGTGV